MNHYEPWWNGEVVSFMAESLEDWHRFPVYLLATAGFRRLRPEHRENVLPGGVSVQKNTGVSRNGGSPKWI